jgi:pilus assembly protein Flp/PilA
MEKLPEIFEAVEIVSGVERKKEEGQGLVEYALILFLVAVVVIAILVLLGPQIGKVFSSVTKSLS